VCQSMLLTRLHAYLDSLLDYLSADVEQLTCRNHKYCGTLQLKAGHGDLGSEAQSNQRWGKDARIGRPLLSVVLLPWFV